MNKGYVPETLGRVLVRFWWHGKDEWWVSRIPIIAWRVETAEDTDESWGTPVCPWDMADPCGTTHRDAIESAGVLSSCDGGQIFGSEAAFVEACVAALSGL